MRETSEKMEQRQEISKIYCNLCGNEIKKNEYGYFEDFLHVHKQWGYHSQKDGAEHQFDLCESCYDKLIKSFRIPVE